MARRRVAVVVLGDVGHSPRMQYHALSLAERADVDVVGYRGAPPLAAVQHNPNISLHLLHPFPGFLPRSLFLLYAPVKIIWQISQLLCVLLFGLKHPDVILVQNPPSIPSLIVAHIVRILRASKLVVDWHNFGYTILNLSLGTDRWDKRLIIRMARQERVLGRAADSHLCVTAAMSRFLRDHWGVTAHVLYDRPAEIFHTTSREERHDLFSRLPTYVAGQPGADELHAAPGPFSLLTHGQHPRPALLVSSTSWTPDEDFSILFDALEDLQARIDRARKPFPSLVLFITGKGPQRAFYEERFQQVHWNNIRIFTVWLAAEDYPLLLGSADLGISLHTSSSGLDLPMKVVDMFGAGCPVLAAYFDCLDELVTHGQNGRVFHTNSDLAADLYDLFKEFPTNTHKLDTMRSHVEECEHFVSRKIQWKQNWNVVAAPVLGF